MSDPIITVEDLGKRYWIRHERERYTALRDVIANRAKSLFRRNGRKSLTSDVRPLPATPELRGGGTSDLRATREDFWALKNVSFEVRQGEVVGIIGRNGAGKTTLLKILSRITEPTEGRVRIKGRVASLLEVGTGFHPELTGRENIYLNGAILGMSRAEIKAKFDEIVAFAETEKFLDTPVKRYSSGMYIRLAFAVAAHLEPDILVIDEVLAVGDAEFQKKCLGKMREVAEGHGRTVLFVSHNLSAVLSLCREGILLDCGVLKGIGNTADVVNDYLRTIASQPGTSLQDRKDREGDGSTRIVSITIQDANGSNVIRSKSRLRVTIQYSGEQSLRSPTFLLAVYDVSNTGLFLLDSDSGNFLPEILPARGALTCETEPINLIPGHCYVNIALSKGPALVDYIRQAASFDVEADDIQIRRPVTRNWVLFYVSHTWTLNNSFVDGLSQSDTAITR